MQTFLPYYDFQNSAQCLDDKRCRNQVKETQQILDILLQNTSHWKNPNAWKNHPAVLMWKGFENALIEYYITMFKEAQLRGTKFVKLKQKDKPIITSYPSWLGKEKFHASHRSNLLRKDFKYYTKFGWKEPNNLPYYWPEKKHE